MNVLVRNAVRTKITLSSIRTFATISGSSSHIPKINSDRFNATLHETCEKFGAAHRYGQGKDETGMARLTLNDDDIAVRKWLETEMEKVGCELKVDSMGNMFFIRPGTKTNVHTPVAMGSHLDTQPMGGRYDGILGIMAAVEAMRTMKDHNIQTNGPIALINWTNEEGARFSKSMCGSSVWSGQLSEKVAHSLIDVHDKKTTMLQELKRSGYLGSMKAHHSAMPLAAHFELHIEQGPILERANAKVGIVQGGQAYKWIQVTINGRECHTGSTPFEDRSDAMQSAAKIIVMSKECARKQGGLASTGLMSVFPSSVNTCPGKVTFTLDVRHKNDASLEAILFEIEREAERICEVESERGTKLQWEISFASNAIKFHKDCHSSIQQAAERYVKPEEILPIISGAGHDSCAASIRCPTAMIFVPSKNGLSHHPEEYTSPEDCAIGAQVLMDSILTYDQQRV
ncbi:hypothetical protein L7F22_019403 [Adiantum nelumboides]|nr:hypothetical protein [Adiantum nelumboides]